jgi:hypothetical protein
MSEHMSGTPTELVFGHCDKCGKPRGENTLTTTTCAHCGSPYEQKTSTLNLDLEVTLEKHIDEITMTQSPVQAIGMECLNCRTTIKYHENQISIKCPFCSTHYQTKISQKIFLIEPSFFLPFQIDHATALASLRNWCTPKWLAPEKFRKIASNPKNLKTIFLPYWKYDCHTQSTYIGKKGVYFQTTKAYKTMEKGKPINKTRAVTQTQWTPVKGALTHSIDNVVIPATNAIPKKWVSKITPSTFSNLTAFNKDFDHSFVLYQTMAKEALQDAYAKIQKLIKKKIKIEIAGDRQKVSQIQTRFSQPSITGILVPVYICSFKHKNSNYQVLIDAQTGEVHGDSPFSNMKISFLLIFCIIGILLLLTYF